MNALPFILAISDEGAAPKIVETVSEDNMYVGYCTPDCKGYDDPKWLIKHIWTESGVQYIFTANGSRQYNQKWEDRNNLTYKPTENFVF
ncbi:MAG: hypothetical protein IJ911_12655 [Salinivirgaceae bacterium]|jgi:hypothetical protein|nr:hypothetical protein [Salinivirgaceae bacterium]